MFEVQTKYFHIYESNEWVYSISGNVIDADKNSITQLVVIF